MGFLLLGRDGGTGRRSGLKIRRPERVVGVRVPLPAPLGPFHNQQPSQYGAHPYAGVTMDAAGNLYGTANVGGDLTCNAPHGCGTVYELKHKGSGFVFNPLYSFGVGPDGGIPTAPVVFGRDGALYSTTSYGGIKWQGHGLQSETINPELAEPRSARGRKTCFIPSKEALTVTEAILSASFSTMRVTSTALPLEAVPTAVVLLTS